MIKLNMSKWTAKKVLSGFVIADSIFLAGVCTREIDYVEHRGIKEEIDVYQDGSIESNESIESLEFLKEELGIIIYEESVNQNHELIRSQTKLYTTDIEQVKRGLEYFNNIETEKDKLQFVASLSEREQQEEVVNTTHTTQSKIDYTFYHIQDNQTLKTRRAYQDPLELTRIATISGVIAYLELCTIGMAAINDWGRKKQETEKILKK